MARLLQLHYPAYPTPNLVHFSQHRAPAIGLTVTTFSFLTWRGVVLVGGIFVFNSVVLRYLTSRVVPYWYRQVCTGGVCGMPGWRHRWWRVLPPLCVVIMSLCCRFY